MIRGRLAARGGVGDRASSTPRRLDLATDPRFQIFAIVFALGVIHHELEFFLELQSAGPLTEYMERWTRVNPSVSWPTSIALSLHVVNIMLSLAVILFRWRRELLCLLAVPLVLSILTMPARVASHNSLMVAVVLVILPLYLAELVERQRRSPSSEWQRGTVVGLCSLLALTYVFAALHKMNPDFFTPSKSGAVSLLEDLAGSFPPARDIAIQVLSYPLMFLTVAVELALAFVLFVPSLRLYGCLLGLVFHLPMMVLGITDFPVLVVAFYPLFLSLDELQVLMARLRARPSVARVVSGLLVGVLGLAVLPHPGQLERFYSLDDPGFDIAVVMIHSLSLCLTFFLFVYVTVTLAGLLISRSLSASQRAASTQPARSFVAQT